MVAKLRYVRKNNSQLRGILRSMQMQEKWEQVSSGTFVQTEKGITTWVAWCHKIGTEGNLRVEKLMYVNSIGEIWE